MDAEAVRVVIRERATKSLARVLRAWKSTDRPWGARWPDTGAGPLKMHIEKGSDAREVSGNQA